MTERALWEDLGRAGKEDAGIGLLGAGIGAGAAAALNILKVNSQRGTFAFMVKGDGSGGIDADAVIGAGLLAIGLMLPGAAGAFTVGAAVGMGTQILAREGAVLAKNHQLKLQAMAVGNLTAGQQHTSGINLLSGGLGRVAGYSMPGIRQAG